MHMEQSQQEDKTISRLAVSGSVTLTVRNKRTGEIKSVSQMEVKHDN